MAPSRDENQDRIRRMAAGGWGWALDLAMMSRAIRFNHDNDWRLDPRIPN